jgi:hypothetical protein
MDPIYDVNRGGYGCGWDLTLDEALREQTKCGGTVMVSPDGGKTWTALDTDA